MEGSAPTTKTKKYRVKSQYVSNGQTPVTLVDGAAVCLGATDAINETAATTAHPPIRKVAKIATQAQLAILFKEGHEMIEEYEG